MVSIFTLFTIASQKFKNFGIKSLSFPKLYIQIPSRFILCTREIRNTNKFLGLFATHSSTNSSLGPAEKLQVTYRGVTFDISQDMKLPQARFGGYLQM